MDDLQQTSSSVVLFDLGDLDFNDFIDGHKWDENGDSIVVTDAFTTKRDVVNFEFNGFTQCEGGFLLRVSVVGFQW